MSTSEPAMAVPISPRSLTRLIIISLTRLRCSRLLSFRVEISDSILLWAFCGRTSVNECEREGEIRQSIRGQQRWCYLYSKYPCANHHLNEVLLSPPLPLPSPLSLPSPSLPSLSSPPPAHRLALQLVAQRVVLPAPRRRLLRLLVVADGELLQRLQHLLDLVLRGVALAGHARHVRLQLVQLAARRLDQRLLVGELAAQLLHQLALGVDLVILRQERRDEGMREGRGERREMTDSWSTWWRMRTRSTREWNRG